MLKMAGGIQNPKHRPDTYFLKQMKKTTEINVPESFGFQMHQGTQRVPRNTVTVANIPHIDGLKQQWVKST